MTNREVTINAASKSVGRVASEAASVLLGKDSADFAKNAAADVVVTVENAEQMYIGEGKRLQSVHKRFSGYPGGLAQSTWSQVIEKKGHAELIKKAVRGMLPNNRLRTARMKNLIVK